jgi:hypothetical protein
MKQMSQRLFSESAEMRIFCVLIHLSDGLEIWHLVFRKNRDLISLTMRSIDMKKSAAKKKKLDKAYNSCIEEINEVCNTYLNAQYKALCFHALEKLKRKLNSPLIK